MATSKASASETAAAPKQEAPLLFTVKDHNAKAISVYDATFHDGTTLLTEPELTNWGPFKHWYKTLTASLALQHSDPHHTSHANPYLLHHISINSLTRFGARIGFLQLTAHITRTAPDAGEAPLPGTIFLRGPAVGMLVVLTPDDTTDDDDEHKYVVLTTQPRVATGSLGFVELPAGMMDDTGEEFRGKVVEEIKEELGMDIKPAELVCLSDEVGQILAARRATRAVGSSGSAREEVKLPVGMFPSAGGCDEYIKIFMARKRVTRDEIRAMEGLETGLRKEGEAISLRVVPLGDLWLEGGRDAKAIAAYCLYMELRKWEREQAGEAKEVSG